MPSSYSWMFGDWHKNVYSFLHQFSGKSGNSESHTILKSLFIDRMAYHRSVLEIWSSFRSHGLFLDLVFSRVSRGCSYQWWVVKIACEQFADTTGLIWAGGTLVWSWRFWGLGHPKTPLWVQEDSEDLRIRGCWTKRNEWSVWICGLFGRCTDTAAKQYSWSHDILP